MKERKNKIVIRGLKVRNSETKRKVDEFMEEEFGIKGRVCNKGMEKGRKEVSNQTIVEMRDWETKETVMRKKKKLGGRVYIQTKIWERKKTVEGTRGESKRRKSKRERSEGKIQENIYIQGRCYVWNSEKKDRREGGFSEETPQDKGITNKRKRRQRERKKDTQQETVRRGKEIEGRRSDEEGSKRGTLLFWNVAGLERKDKDFQNYVKKYNFIGMTKNMGRLQRVGKI